MSSQNKRIPKNILQDVKRMLALQNQGGTYSVNEAAVPLLEPEISSESINIVAAASDESNLHPHTDNSVGGVDVAPVDNTSVVLECEDVVKEAVKEPSISSGAVDVVMPARDYNVGASSRHGGLLMKLLKTLVAYLRKMMVPKMSTLRCVVIQRCMLRVLFILGGHRQSRDQKRKVRWCLAMILRS